MNLKPAGQGNSEGSPGPIGLSTVVDLTMAEGIGMCIGRVSVDGTSKFVWAGTGFVLW